jgi:hypothetical protein
VSGTGSAEKELLHRKLRGQRAHVTGILQGLTDEQLRTPVLPSGWSCLGMLRHLALSDEHYWFRCVVAGETLDFMPEGPRADWTVRPDETVDDVLGLYRAECEAADAIIERTGIDDPPAQPDPVWAVWGMSFPDLRTVLVHVLIETSAHAGHLDAVRELIDGRQWIVLDD